MEPWKLRQRLLEIASLARMEQEHPTGFAMTCLSIIERNAKAALQDLEELAPQPKIEPTPPHLRLASLNE